MPTIHDVLLSEYGEVSSVPTPVNRLMTDFAVGFRDVHDINLGVGYVNERTIPHQQVQLACEKVLTHPEKYRAALYYSRIDNYIYIFMIWSIESSGVYWRFRLRLAKSLSIGFNSGAYGGKNSKLAPV